MTTPELPTPPRPTASTDPAGHPRLGDELAEIVPLVGVIAVAGPPVVLLAAPWLLFGLLLAGPFTLLVTVAVLIVAVAALVRVTRAVLAAPYRLVRRLGRYREAHAPTQAATASLVVAGSRWHAA